MIRILKCGISAEQDAAEQSKVRQTVEPIIADIERRGGAAVREYSHRFDGWNPPESRLTREESRLAGRLGKLIKPCTCQRVKPEANAMIGEYCSRWCALEGFAGHQAPADLRIRRYGAKAAA